ncbi:hypothetical protein [Halorussus ruber]|uniref:hypothetical protein n=1 Tax=Halorussus ruber TaxID=1126238 RepID=UPI00109249DE|nr:hypothetical protein [Halorussus ruber]
MKRLKSVLLILAVVTVAFSGVTTGVILQDAPEADATSTTATATTASTTATATTASTTATTATAATTATTTAAAACDPSDDGPQLRAARLYTRDTNIAPDDPGRISGSIASGVANTCPTQVEITLHLPDGVSVSDGQTTSSFVVEPGEVQGFRTEVYSDDLGTKTVRASITYFPVGHRDMAKKKDDLALQFEVSEETNSKALGDDSTATETKQDPDGGIGIPGFSVISAVAGLALAGLLLAGKQYRDGQRN